MATNDDAMLRTRPKSTLLDFNKPAAESPPDMLAYHRVGWLRELPPGKMHHEKNAAVITRISLRVLED